MQFLEIAVALDHSLQQVLSSSLSALNIHAFQTLLLTIGMVLSFLLLGTFHLHKYDVTGSGCSSGSCSSPPLNEMPDFGLNDVGLIAVRA